MEQLTAGQKAARTRRLRATAATLVETEEQQLDSAEAAHEKHSLAGKKAVITNKLHAWQAEVASGGTELGLESWVKEKSSKPQVKPKHPAKSESPFDQKLKWLNPEENPCGLRVLDCRSFTMGVLSSTSDENIAHQFSELRESSGEQHRGQTPVAALSFECDLRYPSRSVFSDGPLFVSGQMEDKWDIYFYDSYLYFARSWTGILIHRAALETEEGGIRVRRIETSSGDRYNDSEFPVRSIDFLIKTYLFHLEAPHPLPRSLPDDSKAIAQFSFANFGCRAHYATYDDTIKA